MKTPFVDTHRLRNSLNEDCAKKPREGTPCPLRMSILFQYRQIGTRIEAERGPVKKLERRDAQGFHLARSVLRPHRSKGASVPCQTRPTGPRILPTPEPR